MDNLWPEFENLLPSAALQIGTVAAVHADGTSTLDLLGGGSIRVLGDSHSVGTDVFFRDGAIVDAAASMTDYQVTV